LLTLRGLALRLSKIDSGGKRISVRPHAAGHKAVIFNKLESFDDGIPFARTFKAVIVLPTLQMTCHANDLANKGTKFLVVRLNWLLSHSECLRIILANGQVELSLHLLAAKHREPCKACGAVIDGCNPIDQVANKVRWCDIGKYVGMPYWPTL
jgi:hypothetical protein